MNIFQKIIYTLLEKKEKSLKIRLDKHFKRSSTNSTSKTVMSSNATLTLTSETLKNAQLVRENVEAIVKKTGGNPLELLEFIKSKGTPVYRPANADKFLNLIGEEEGFIVEQHGKDALLLNIVTGRGISFKSVPMFVMREGNIDPYYFLHHFYRWYAMKYRLPGFDSKAQKLLKIFLKNANDERLKNLNLDDMLALKEAIARDNEASDFVIALAKHKDGSKQVLKKIQEEGGANI